MLIPLFNSQEIISTRKVYLREDSGTIEDGERLIHRRDRIPALPSDRIEFVVVNTQMEATIIFIKKRTGAPVEEELCLMKPFSTFSEKDPPVQYDDNRHSVEEVSMLSPCRIHPNNGAKQEVQPSAQFQFILALPHHPTSPTRMHGRIKEEGLYSLERHEVKI
ncbi:hypothetical protein O181_012688 [Austropuccinia psidii MF-1]|uniref:Uncharacterized protein n=1 Tax=Austropuccinia psidii MF-1 TaxID=1389203 RepID=A0A9Q3GMF3_9BASI|nr:hypothetical protein [Austropuccinia psidii MF-1]